MTAFALIAVASLLAALLTRKRPVIWVSAAVASLVGLPKVASREVLAGAGGLADVHPATLLLIAGTVVSVITPRTAGSRVGRPPLLLAVMAWSLVGLVLAVLVWGGAPTFVVIYILPALAFVGAAVATQRIDPALPRKLARVILLLAAAQASLAVLQWLTGSALLYESAFANNYWWRSNLTRALGTLDSPLDLAAFLTMALPFIALVRRTWIAFGLAVILMSGTFVTGSRIGIVVAVVVVVWVLLTHSRNPLVGIFVSLLLSIAGLLFLSGNLADQLLDRFGARGDSSTDVRSEALVRGLQLVGDKPWLGHGTGSAYSFSQSQLESSFENGYLALGIDSGLPLVVALLSIQIVAVLGGGRASFVLRLPGALAIVWGFSYSAFASGSSFGTLSWLMIGLSMLLARTAASEADATIDRKGRSAETLGGVRAG